MANITFEYSLGQEVIVKEIGTRGRIDSVSKNLNGEQYRVVYWIDGERRSDWLYNWEIMEVA